jgi:ABC-type transport system involved in Fe-S cluster assembly fused permease/ATPase subunit
VKQQAYIEIAEQTFGHLHSLSLQWHLKKKMGNVIRSMDRGTDAANNLITYLFLYLVPAIGKLYVLSCTELFMVCCNTVFARSYRSGAFV